MSDRATVLANLINYMNAHNTSHNYYIDNTTSFGDKLSRTLQEAITFIEEETTDD